MTSAGQSAAALGGGEQGASDGDAVGLALGEDDGQRWRLHEAAAPRALLGPNAIHSTPQTLSIAVTSAVGLVVSWWRRVGGRGLGKFPARPEAEGCPKAMREFYTRRVRRNLQPSDLGDLLDRPQNAVIGLHRADGSILLTPVWHLFRQGSFYFQVPGGDRKIAMLKRDPRCTILVAESEHPYRAIEATGEGQLSTDDYERLGSAIVQRYVTAHDPDANVSDYLLSGGVIVRVTPTSLRAWDYADAEYV